MHKAGIEVILDVVYNHTAEGNQMGPTLFFKGIDNSSYYRLTPENKRYYMDYTGTGNTLNTYMPSVLKLLMDSLRYWILEMHIDGMTPAAGPDRKSRTGRCRAMAEELMPPRDCMIWSGVRTLSAARSCSIRSR